LTVSGPATTYDDAVAVAIQRNGKIVAVGSSNGDFGQFDILVTRLNANGTLDGTFGGGMRLINFGGSPVGGTAGADAGFALAIQPDQRIVVAGSSNVNGDSDFGVARLTTSGGLDPGFNLGSPLAVDISGNADDVANGVIVRSRGRIVLAGSRESG